MRTATVRKILYTTTGVYWTFIFLLTHVPQETLPKVHLSDKIEHILAFGVLGGLLFFSLRISRFRVNNIPVTVLLIAMSYGAIDEWLQALPFINRYCELADWMADTTGAALAVVILTHLVRSTQRYTISS